MSSYTRQQLEEWTKTIDVKADRVLDVGGSQLPIKGRTKSWDVGDYKILDLEQPHECKVESDYKIDLNERIDFGKIEFNLDNNGLSKYERIFEKFDIAFCLEVSEYWWNPIEALRNINDFLKKEGILYISFHFIYPMHNPVGEDCLRYTKWGVERLLDESGFEIDRGFSKPRLAQNENLLRHWIEGEKMRPSRDYQGHNEVGYLVKAIKR